VDTFIEVIETKKLTEGQMQVFLQEARIVSIHNSIFGLRRLFECANHFSEAKEAIWNFFQSKKWQHRFHVVNDSSRGPDDLRERILKTALNDKSSRVRCKAADESGRYKQGKLFPELRIRLELEENKDVKQSIHYILQN